MVLQMWQDAFHIQAAPGEGIGLGEERGGSPGDLIFIGGEDGASDCTGGLLCMLGGVLLFMLKSSSPLFPFTGCLSVSIDKFFSLSPMFGFETCGLVTFSLVSEDNDLGGIPGK